VLGIRHSAMEVHREETPGAIPGRVYTVEPTGDITYAHIYLGSHLVVASVPPEVILAPDDPVWIIFDQERIHLFDGTTQQVLAAD
jgi:multiple sugar transport system ATP-binding protein